MTPPVASVRRQRSIEQIQQASPAAPRRGVAWEREPVVDVRIDLDLVSRTPRYACTRRTPRLLAQVHRVGGSAMIFSINERVDQAVGFSRSP